MAREPTQEFNAGRRLAISALFNENGFHRLSIDMFQCDQEHSMDSLHFIQWNGQTCSILREELGRIFGFLIARDSSFIKEMDLQ